MFASCSQLAEVNDHGLVCSAILSTLSHNTALLTILHPGIMQDNQLLTADIIAPTTDDTSADLPDVVNSVLGVVYDIMAEGDSADGEDGVEIPRVQNNKCLSSDFLKS